MTNKPIKLFFCLFVCLWKTFYCLARGSRQHKKCMTHAYWACNKMQEVTGWTALHCMCGVRRPDSVFGVSDICPYSVLWWCALVDFGCSSTPNRNRGHDLIHRLNAKVLLAMLMLGIKIQHKRTFLYALLRKSLRQSKELLKTIYLGNRCIFAQKKTPTLE